MKIWKCRKHLITLLLRAWRWCDIEIWGIGNLIALKQVKIHLKNAIAKERNTGLPELFSDFSNWWLWFFYMLINIFMCFSFPIQRYNYTTAPRFWSNVLALVKVTRPGRSTSGSDAMNPGWYETTGVSGLSCFFFWGGSTSNPKK